MGFLESAAGILAIIAIFIVLPKIIFSFISKNNKEKRDTELEKLRYQKEILQLEVDAQNNKIRLLEEENKKYDNIINNS